MSITDIRLVARKLLVLRGDRFQILPHFQEGIQVQPRIAGRVPCRVATRGSMAGWEVLKAKGARQVSMMSTPASMALR